MPDPRLSLAKAVGKHTGVSQWEGLGDGLYWLGLNFQFKDSYIFSDFCWRKWEPKAYSRQVEV